MSSEKLVQRSTVDAVLELAALDNSDWNDVLQKILRVDSQTLAIERASYWTFCAEPRMISCELGYVRSADGFERGATLFAADSASYIDELAHAKVIRIVDVATDPRTRDLRAYCRARNISSMLDVPVWVGSKLTGVLCHEHVGPQRPWTRVEIDFVLAVAQIIATALEARRRSHAEDDARRAWLLSQASLLMSQTLDERAVAERAVAGALPRLADWAALDRFEGEEVERLAIAHADPHKQQLIAEYAAAYPPARTRRT